MSEQQVTDQTKLKRYSRLLRERRKLQVVSYIAVILLGGILAREWYFPAAFMLIYFFLWLVRTKDDFSRLELGDRMYFMGYTFTLISLGYVLYDPTKYAGTLEAFYYFGTAVFTSILGLIIRSGLHLFHRNPEEQMDEVNAKISIVGEKVVADLDKFSETLNARISRFEQDLQQIQQSHQTILRDNIELFSRSTSQATREFGENVSQVLQTSLQSLNDYQTSLIADLTQTRETLQRQFNELTGTLIKEIEQIKNESKSTLQQFSKNHSEFAETLSNLTMLQKESISTVQKNLDLLTAKTSTTAESAMRILTTFTTTLSSQTEKAVKSSNQTYETLNAAFSDTLKLVQQLNGHVSDLKQKVSADGFLKPISESFDLLQQSVQRVSNASSRVLQLLKDLNQNAADAKEVARLIDEIRETIKAKLDAEFIRK